MQDYQFKSLQNYLKMKLKIKKFYKNKTILVTGGTGTIGSTIIMELLNYDCKVIRVLSNDENSLFDLSEKIKIFKKVPDDNFNKNMLKSKIRYFLEILEIMTGVRKLQEEQILLYTQPQ